MNAYTAAHTKMYKNNQTVRIRKRNEIFQMKLNVNSLHKKIKIYMKKKLIKKE